VVNELLNILDIMSQGHFVDTSLSSKNRGKRRADHKVSDDLHTLKRVKTMIEDFESAGLSATCTKFVRHSTFSLVK